MERITPEEASRCAQSPAGQWVTFVTTDSPNAIVENGLKKRDDAEYICFWQNKDECVMEHDSNDAGAENDGTRFRLSVVVDLEAAVLDGIEFFKRNDNAVVTRGNKDGVLPGEYLLNIVTHHGFMIKTSLSRQHRAFMLERRAGALAP